MSEATLNWEKWPGSIYTFLEVWDDVDARTVSWRRAADGTIEVRPFLRSFASKDA